MSFLIIFISLYMCIKPYKFECESVYIFYEYFKTHDKLSHQIYKNPINFIYI
jgi:hypothetical protein